MIPIPVEIDAMLAIINLPKEMGDNGIFKEHKAIVMETIRTLILDNHYQDAIRNDYPDDDPFLISFRFGFCFLMLHSTCEFLNLKTLGEGIVKTVGLDQSATELLTGSEIDAFKANLELRALTGLRDYLNQHGQDRLYELKPRLPRVIRVGVI
ncbi:MAG: hypothetical protein CVU48_10325 [Candidatus Cloacimonetes bacterium HGW-Cloacimonetes-1]|jgi:hypothetical protein|nr:MAG: hypothetical protein CVU48_10325 [Candidatus Cloacimonetes bacterium HGW-Cloacimonetes-1]